MRDFILLYINGKKHKITIEDAKKNLSSYLRENLNMKGTKIVCSEGDCGACTVLMYRYKGEGENFVSINACIAPLYLLDCCHIVTYDTRVMVNSNDYIVTIKKRYCVIQ